LTLVQAALQRGKKKANAWYPDVSLLFFTPEKITPYDPLGQTFININTPKELCETENYARQIEESEPRGDKR